MKQSLLKRVPLEAYFWGIGLVSLFFLDPYSAGHFTLCPLRLAGFDWCPGCGLGRSISFLFSGDFPRSFEAHPLGIFALTILLFRIFTLLKSTFYGQNY
jgi:hypothetical protein